MGLSVSQGVHSFEAISAGVFGFEKFSLSSDVLFPFFLSSSHVWWWPFLILQSTCSFLSLQAFWCFPDSILSVVCFFRFSLRARYNFQCQIRFQYPGYIFLLFVQGFLFFFILWKYLDNIHVHQVINIFFRFCKLSMYLSGIIVITNSSGESESRWNIKKKNSYLYLFFRC